MHRLSVDMLQPGAQIGRNLYNDRGDILLARGTPLDAAYIAAVRQRGYRFIYVLDGIADDVEPLGLISQRLRSATVRNLNSVFELMGQATQPGRESAPPTALQHHEHQDGSGYPNGLTGLNRLFRTPRERFDPALMTLLAELAAVADVCSALSSDRPYRSALPAPEVLQTMRGMAGHLLNREAVEAFGSMVEVFPVGVHGGRAEPSGGPAAIRCAGRRDS